MKNMKNKKIKALSKWLEERGYEKQVFINPYDWGCVRTFHKTGFGITLKPASIKIEGKVTQYWRCIIYGRFVDANFELITNRITLKTIKEWIKRAKRYERNNIRRINNNDRNNTK